MSDGERDACCLIKKQPDAEKETETESDQVVLITGCASGVGLSTALAFAKLNSRLVLVDTNATLLAEAAQLCSQASSKQHQVSLLSSSYRVS